MLRHRFNLRQISIEMESVVMLLPPANGKNVVIILPLEAALADRHLVPGHPCWPPRPKIQHLQSKVAPLCQNERTAPLFYVRLVRYTLISTSAPLYPL